MGCLAQINSFLSVGAFGYSDFPFRQNPLEQVAVEIFVIDNQGRKVFKVFRNNCFGSFGLLDVFRVSFLIGNFYGDLGSVVKFTINANCSSLYIHQFFNN